MNVKEIIAAVALFPGLPLLILGAMFLDDFMQDVSLSRGGEGHSGIHWLAFLLLMGGTVVIGVIWAWAVP